GTITTYPIPTENSGAEEIAVGSDGALWFTEHEAGKIGRITTAGDITEFPIANGTVQQPFGITAGPDNALWFTRQGSGGNDDLIGRITTAGVSTSYPIPTSNGLPVGIVAGPDGNLWFTLRSGNKVAKITTDGDVTEYPLPNCPCWPEGIAVGADGNLWLAEAAGAITRVDTTGNAFDFYIPAEVFSPKGIVGGPDGALWYTGYDSNHIGRVTTTGVFDQFTPPTALSKPYGIALGPDGNLWFTEQDGDRIGRAAAELVTLTVTTTNDGESSGTTGTAPAGATTGATTRAFGPGDVVALSPQPAAGSTFAGWTVDGVYRGWETPLTITMEANHAVEAAFVKTVNFPDVTTGQTLVAVRELASRGAIFGYTNGNYGVNDPVQRAQMAALIARATPNGPDTPPTMLTPPDCVVANTWDCEDWGNTFTDQSGVPASLWRDAGTLQHYRVAFGYSEQDCAKKGRAFPCYGPTDQVSQAQTIAFIARAMVAKGYWEWQLDAPLPDTGVPGVLAKEVRTYIFYTGGVPAAPTSAAGWNGVALRGWFARALWTALDSYWGKDVIMPDGRPAGGYVP
ncbi:MAG: S-layer homology domain-containing protein, partial [Thermomicrobiales bacterium]